MENYLIFRRLQKEDGILISWEIDTKTIEKDKEYKNFFNMIDEIDKKDKKLFNNYDNIEVYTNVYKLKYNKGKITKTKIAYLKNGTLYTH